MATPSPFVPSPTLESAASAPSEPPMRIPPLPPVSAVEVDWLYQVLSSVQLEQFYVRLRDQLQVSRLEHFDYVTCADLEKVGMARPAARRLLDLIKKRRRKAMVGKLLPAPLQNRFGSLKGAAGKGSYGGAGASSSGAPGMGQVGGAGAPAVAHQQLTCLIQAKDITLQGN